MKKVVLIIVAVIVALVGGYIVVHFILPPDPPVDPDPYKDKTGRYITIINETGSETINRSEISVGEGSVIEETIRENPDKASYSVEIPKQYKEFDTFTVTLIDNYGLKYEKTQSGVKETGVTEIVLTKEDGVKQPGDWKRKIDKFFNEHK